MFEVAGTESTSHLSSPRRLPQYPHAALLDRDFFYIRRSGEEPLVQLAPDCLYEKSH